jgi:hypothetical protein
VLDDIERRRFLVQPAGEDAAPALVGALDVDLDEGPGQLLFLPRRGRLARAQAHDHVLPAGRLTGVQRDVLNDAVALVEDAEHRHALSHRRDSALPRRGRRTLPPGGHRRILLLSAAAAGDKRKRKQQRWCDTPHAYSGIQGS